MKKKIIIISTLSILIIAGIVATIIIVNNKPETKLNNNQSSTDVEGNKSDENNQITNTDKDEKKEEKDLEENKEVKKEESNKNNNDVMQDTKKEEAKKNNSTNNTSNNTQTTQQSKSSTQEQPKTEEPKQNLYYGTLAPKGTANPTYMLDASDATHNAIAQDSKKVEFMRGQVPNGPGGRSVSIDVFPEPWSKTKDFMNPDGYTYIGYIFITSGDPAWSDTSIQYKGYGSNRIIAEFYWTNKNGSKAWKWNPNGYHF